MPKGSLFTSPSTQIPTSWHMVQMSGIKISPSSLIRLSWRILLGSNTKMRLFPFPTWIKLTGQRWTAQSRPHSAIADQRPVCLVIFKKWLARPEILIPSPRVNLLSRGIKSCWEKSRSRLPSPCGWLQNLTLWHEAGAQRDGGKSCSSRMWKYSLKGKRLTSDSVYSVLSLHLFIWLPLACMASCYSVWVTSEAFICRKVEKGMCTQTLNSVLR